MMLRKFISDDLSNKEEILYHIITDQKAMDLSRVITSFSSIISFFLLYQKFIK